MNFKLNLKDVELNISEENAVKVGGLEIEYTDVNLGEIPAIIREFKEVVKVITEDNTVNPQDELEAIMATHQRNPILDILMGSQQPNEDMPQFLKDIMNKVQGDTPATHGFAFVTEEELVNILGKK